GLRAEWDSFLSGKSAGPLVAAILHKAASARAAGAVLSFPSRLLLSINQLSELRRAGVTSVVLYGSTTECLEAFLAQEKRLGRVNGDPVQHWLFNNQQAHVEFSRPEFAPFRLAAFRNGERV